MTNPTAEQDTSITTGSFVRLTDPAPGRESAVGQVVKIHRSKHGASVGCACVVWVAGTEGQWVSLSEIGGAA